MIPSRLTHVVAATSLVALTLTTPLSGQQPLDDRQRREAVTHFKSGMQALVADRFEVAEREFRQAVRLDPLYDAAFYGLGQVCMATKRYDEALEAYLWARDAFKTSTTAEVLDSVAADRRLKDQIEALRDYVTSLERQSPTQSPTLSAVIDRNRDQIRALEGRLSRNRSDAAPPVPAGFSLAIGSAYFRLNQVPEAEREYLAAIQVDKKFGEAYSNLAVVYLLTGRYRDADEAVRTAERVGFKVNPQLKLDIERAIRTPMARS